MKSSRLEMQLLEKIWNKINNQNLNLKRNASDNTYSVMQSDGNSFCGDVVSDSFNKRFRDEDKILDQIYQNKYVRITNTNI